MAAKLSLTGILWRLLPSVRTRERPRFLFFASLYALVSLAQTLGLAGSEALFLSRLGAGGLPAAFILSAVVTVLGTLAYAFVVGRVRNDRLYIIMLLAAAVVLIAAAGAALRFPSDALALGLFCAFFVTQAVFITHYRTFATDFFDTLAAKRLFPGFAIGASIGGTVGGLIALGLSRVAPPETLIGSWGLVLVAAAVLLQRGRPRLRRWGPLGLEEADESSVEGLQGAVRLLRRSPLARWLVTSVIGMVFSLSILHYLSSGIFVDSFPTAAGLAGFFGVYLALTNALEIAVLLWITPWLIRRFGVAQSNLIHPLLTLSCFGALAFAPVLSVAVVARANREMIESALAGEVRNLSYNAVSFRFRGSMRALLEGIVFYAAMSVAGVAILVAGEGIESRWLAAVGAAAAVLYAAANWRVRGEYLRSLVSDIRAGRLDLESIEADLGSAEVARLAEQWEALIEDERGHPSRASLELPALLAERGIRDPLKRAAQNSHPRVRSVCFEALSAAPDASLASLLADGLHDAHPDVRLSAARAVGCIEQRPEPLLIGLQECLNDAHPEVRAEAAVHLGEDGFECLRSMALGDDGVGAVAAIERLPDALVDCAESRLDSADPAVRAAALNRVGRASTLHLLSPERLERELSHDDSRVREAATRALAEAMDAEVPALLARALDDVSRAVRERASLGLAALGDRGVEQVENVVDGSRVWTVDAALSALAGAGTPRARAALERAFRQRVRAAWQSLAALEFLAPDEETEAFLWTALANSHARDQWFAFRILELLEDDPGVVRSIRKALRGPVARTRSDALEVLTNLADRETSQLLALILEEGPFDDKVPSVKRLIEIPGARADVIRDAHSSRDRWVRMGASSLAPAQDSPSREEDQTMQRLLALRNVPLFAHLSLEQLEAISRPMREAQYLKGEVVCREGEQGDELFVLLEGEVEILSGHGTAHETRIRSIEAVGYFGEIAILSDTPRTATIVVSRDARMLTLDGDRFKELVLQAPELSFEIFRVLTEMLREAEERAKSAAGEPTAG